MDKQKLRCIVLDSCSNTAIGFGTSTVAFLHSTLASVPNGYKVVAFAHCPTRPSYFSPQSNVPNGAEIENEINSFIDNGGFFIGYIHGHTHFDNITRDSGMKFSEIAITTQQTGGVAFSLSEDLSGLPIKYTDRTIEYLSAYSIDFACIHVDTGTINMYRLGVGKDREVSGNTVIVDNKVSVNGTKNLNGILVPLNIEDDTIIWSSSDESKATVSGGIVTGIATGVVTIKAKGQANGNTAECVLNVV